MNKYKKWLKYTILLAFLLGVTPFLLLASFNYYIDPLWNFSHSNYYNKYQQPFDERLQKTNYITNRGYEFDALLLGDSRVTYINQYDFKDNNVFNYAASALILNEYNDYIEYAKKKNGNDLNLIILGLSFHNTGESVRQRGDEPKYYFEQSNENLYKYTSLFSKNTLDLSLDSFYSTYQNEIRYRSGRIYNRYNIADARNSSEATTENRINRQIEELIDDAKDYKYNPEYKDMLIEIKQNNPNSKFIIFTTPVTYQRLEAQLSFENVRLGYEQWITDIVDVFGGVYNFNYKNSITVNIGNFYDSHHYYPDIGKLIAQRITQNNDDEIPTDFGILVTKENINDHLDKVLN